MSAQLLANFASTWAADWNQIHSEREEICEELVRNSTSDVRNTGSQIENGPLSRRLEARLRLLDDAMDRLMAGSYGHCESCGQRITDARLQADPTVAKCSLCESVSSHCNALGI